MTSKSEIPEVDAWFGTMELPLILKQFDADYKTELLGRTIAGHAPTLCLPEDIRRLQPYLCFLCHPADARATCQQTD